MTIELTADEFDLLLLMCGYAAGAASKDNQSLMYSFIRMANAVNRNNPHWTPYEIPAEEEPQA